MQPKSVLYQSDEILSINNYKQSGSRTIIREDILNGTSQIYNRQIRVFCIDLFEIIKILETLSWRLMHQQNYSNTSYPEIKEKQIEKDSLIFAFTENDILLVNGTVPLYKKIETLKVEINYIKYLGSVEDKSCFAIDIAKNAEIFSEYSKVGLRKLYSLLNENELKAAVYAFQIILWNRKNKYCGGCATKTEELVPNVLVKTCPSCKEEYYPKISPSIIVAIKKGNKILLAQHKRITSGMYTILAGFVNPGESLEECIHREVEEEAGIKVTNLRYFGSQPWPFPDSLMIGFFADYVSGDLKPEKEEITDLKWFVASEIPEWPDKVSIARSLIDSFIEENIS